ncbi:hypothetical protein AQUCO_00100385v1 [Aquilegia coerulea]|uniref:RING-type E3 ubiquitin transferase n=1 Tax=Aquilegia coerulea TaxID=218851 RepID=A0A2G5FA53_AQUCA|nr:hypothetical protein AQUCO_00100385v1 [Aquilegia coerulea]
MSTAATTSTITSAQILHHTSTFIAEVLSQTDLRRQIFSTLSRKIHPDQIIVKPLTVAVETIENAISTTNPATRISSLRLVEKLLQSYPENVFSALILSLVYGLRQRPINAALSLLDVFNLDPLSARSEIAPILFEDLFLLHLIPVLQGFNDCRSKILSSKPPDKISKYQGKKLKNLEKDYEEVLDENCKVFAGYLKEVVEDRDGTRSISPPPLILTKFSDEGEVDFDPENKLKIEDIKLSNGRYNPIWAEAEEGSIEFYSSSSSNKSKSPHIYPQRVSPRVFSNQRSTTTRSNISQQSKSDSESLSSDNISTDCSTESEPDVKERNRKVALFEPKPTKSKKHKQLISARSSCSKDSVMEDSENLPGSGKYTPPKDFVCPITSNIFDDPVTLETGQTYERRAIQEWLDRGNSTCPITRQKLQSTQLPKTNYVLKRLIASWQEEIPEATQILTKKTLPKSGSSSNLIKPSTSPTSVIIQATSDGTFAELRLAITNLCMSEILVESETAVLRIQQFWREANMESEIQTMLSKPAVVNGFVEILFNSVDPRVLSNTVYLLSELGYRDKSVIQTLTRVDSDVDCVVALFRKGLMEAIVLIYLLRPSTVSLIEMDIIDSLLTVIKKKEEDSFEMCLRPKQAAILLLAQILGSGEETNISSIAQSVVSSKAIEILIGSLEADWSEERIAAVGILLRCMQEDGKCRKVIADKAVLTPILESFIGSDDAERFKIVHFLSELVKLNRRKFNEQILHIIKDEGAFSTMHTLLVYLQTALQDQIPVVAGLLLQLDLLTEPRKMSMYREEAIDALISCLRNSNFPSAQITAAETIMCLQGRYSVSGKPLARTFLLKRVGLDRDYKTIMRKEKLGLSDGQTDKNLDEEKAAEEWERKMASVLVSHEFGLLFEALAEGLRSRYAELSSASFVSATWLAYMLTLLPDTGVRGAARVCLLKQFVSIFQSAKDPEDKALAMLALSSFIHAPEGLRDLTLHVKDILKGLRELKKQSSLASEMLKIFSEGQDSSSNDLWNHKELIKVDCSGNGEVLSIICFKDKIFSGHSDGSLKVWSRKSGHFHLIQEVQEHTKGVTSLAIIPSGERLYSGSLDKTARVWALGHELIHCIQVHDMKDQVHNMVVANSIACFIPQGPGVKVHAWSGESKLLNTKQNVKCMALVQGKLYCGCNDSSIQEIDLATGTMSTIQTGNRKLLVKANPIHALQVSDAMIYSATSPLDGAAVKIWSASDFSMIGSLPTTSEVRAMAVSSELIYLGCKMGAVEIWCKEKHTRVETLITGTSGKVMCMSLDGDEEVLVIGTSDGQIQAWGLS